MNYIVEQDCIRIFDADTFEPRSILTSGQLFRFGEGNSGDWWVATGSNFATIEKSGEASYVIHTSTPEYFVDFFDLKTDYSAILGRLGKFEQLKPAIEFGRGVRLMKQPLIEVIIGFIISANNNIPRIRKSIEAICEKFGTKHAWGFGFPDLEQLSKASAEDFKEFGCGFRAKYLVDTIRVLNSSPILEELRLVSDTATARKRLLSLKGVGPKVADCILLFGLWRYDVFPVDTWIDKVYREDFGGNLSNREQISGWFVQKFGADSGYCQQYLFYYKRKDIKLK